MTRKKYQSEWKAEHYKRQVYPYMSQLWYPGAEKDVVYKDSGGWLSEYAWRGVLHTTEGGSYAGARSQYLKGVPPHFTVSYERGYFQAWQHIPINRASRALANPPGGVETNRARAIQIEIVGRASQSGSFPRPYLDGIGKLMRWCEANTEIARSSVSFYGDQDGIVLARLESPARMKPSAWKNFSGWCGHQHVPENAHWDPGAIDIKYLLAVDIGVRPVVDPPLDFNDVVDVRQDKYTEHGVYMMQQDGAVFAFRGAVFYMGVNGQGFFEGRKAAQLLWPEEAEARDGGDWRSYKYVILATSGEMYGCPWR